MSTTRLKKYIHSIAMLVFFALCFIERDVTELWEKILLILVYYGCTNVVVDFIFCDRIQVHSMHMEPDEKEALRVVSFASGIFGIGISVFGIIYGIDLRS